MITIDIISDHVCPWCYVGKRRLESALAQRPDIETRINWRPFQLNPDIPREGKDRLQHMQSIFGEERAQMILDKLPEFGAQDGLQFSYKPGSKAPNTMAAHTLMHWAGEISDDTQHQLQELLFKANFIDCEDIGDPATLAKFAAEVGMDSEEVLEKLKTQADEEKVKEEIRDSQSKGVSGVPCFIFNNQHAVEGAQSVESLVSVLDQLSTT